MSNRVYDHLIWRIDNEYINIASCTWDRRFKAMLCHRCPSDSIQRFFSISTHFPCVFSTIFGKCKIWTRYGLWHGIYHDLFISSPNGWGITMTSADAIFWSTLSDSGICLSHSKIRLHRGTSRCIVCAAALTSMPSGRFAYFRNITWNWNSHYSLMELMKIESKVNKKKKMNVKIYCLCKFPFALAWSASDFQVGN